MPPRAGMVGYDLVFELMRSMDEEKSFIVWKAARRGFRYMQTMLSRTGAFGDIQVWYSCFHPVSHDVLFLLFA